MERTMSVEEKIRRAEEIYERRRQKNNNKIEISNSNKEKKEIKLFKKMLIQFFLCILIYLTIYMINSSDFVFSEDFIHKTKEILSYDTNFFDLYDQVKLYIEKKINNNEESNVGQEEQNEEKIEKDEQGIGGANEEVKDSEEQLSQVEQDIISIKNTTTFIKPIEGVISSKYGIRENATGSVPKNHTGTDIAANIGTKIKSSTDGEVVLASDEGDYGKHLKIQIGEVSIIYAHCNNLYVKQGDKVCQGQEIAEVGSTGNSTGPHLHFEIRFSERTVDPQSVLEL